MSERYLISLISLLCFQWRRHSAFPECLFRHPILLIRDALELGYDSLLGLPLRGMTGAERSISFYQNAWNPVYGLKDIIFKRNGRMGVPGTIIDWLAFPNPDACNSIEILFSSRGIPRINTKMPESVPLLVTGKEHNAYFVEVHPALDKTPEKIIEACQKDPRIRLALDTHHLTRDYREDEILLKPERKDKSSPLGTTEQEWLRAAKDLAPYVDMVHVHPENLEEFLWGDRELTVTYKIIQKILEWRPDGRKGLTFVAEFKPNLSDHQHDDAKRFLDHIKTF